MQPKTTLLFAAFACMAACGGDGDTAVTVVAPPKTGAIVIAVRGLPANLAPNVELQAGSNVARFPASDTIAGLGPATYTVTAKPVENADARFSPAVETFAITLRSAEIHTVAIDYAEVTGRLAVNLDGLPAGTGAPIDVAGPAAFSAHLAQADTLRKLAPGTYTLTPASTSGSPRYVPDSSTQTMRVDSARLASVVVRFHPVVTLTVQIDGLPSGVSASVDVTGPAFTRHLTGPATLSDLPLATYTITPATITVGFDVYRASTQSILLSIAGPNTVAVHYVRQLARIAFQLQNGPTGMGNPSSPIVRVSGPTTSFSLSRDTVVDGLPFGTYRYTVYPVVYDVAASTGYTHDPSGVAYTSPLIDRTDLSVTLDDAHTSASVVVPLTLLWGAATFSAPGSTRYSGGFSPAAVFSTANIIPRTVEEDYTGVRLPAGTYTVTPYRYGQFPDLDLPNAATVTATISATSPVARVVIPYHRIIWPIINVGYSGMPAGLQVGFQLSWLTGLGYNEFYNAPITVTRSEMTMPGVHRLTASSGVTNNDLTLAWVPAPEATDFVAQEGVTTNVTIPMRSANLLRVDVLGLPIEILNYAISTSSVSVTSPSGLVFHLLDFLWSNRLAYRFNVATGTWVANAANISVDGKTWVPDRTSQSITLSSAGTVVITVNYTLRP